jgi:hypothetical protein
MSEDFPGFGGPSGPTPEGEPGVWLATTVLVSLFPFLLTAGLYLVFFRQWSSPARLIGHGEAMLVVLAICGSTFAEVFLHPRRDRTLKRTIAFLTIVLATLTATAFTEVFFYAALAQHGPSPAAATTAKSPTTITGVDTSAVVASATGRKPNGVPAHAASSAAAINQDSATARLGPVTVARANPQLVAYLTIFLIMIASAAHLYLMSVRRQAIPVAR